jgi:hypothetical protein
MLINSVSGAGLHPRGYRSLQKECNMQGKGFDYDFIHKKIMFSSVELKTQIDHCIGSGGTPSGKDG